MRSRLVAAFVGLGVAIVLLFGIPRGVSVVHVVHADRQALLDRSADLAVLVIADAKQDGDQVTGEMLLAVVAKDEAVEYRPPGSRALFAPVSATPPTSDDLTADRSAPGGGSVTVFIPRAAVNDEVRRALAPLLLLGLGLVLFSVVVGSLGARRLSRPFTELADVADDVGHGRLDTTVPRSGTREADVIGRVLGDVAHHLRRLVRREREVSDRASHDLRTPVTALRLSLEDLEQWPETAPEVAEELRRLIGEVDRLSDAVSHIVDARTPEEPPRRIDVGRLVREVIGGRTRSKRPARIELADDGGQVAEAVVPPELCRRAIGLLLEHVTDRVGGDAAASVQAGSGYVRVELRGATNVTADEGVVWDQAIGTALDLGGRLTSTRGPDGLAVWSLLIPVAPNIEDS